MAHTTHTWKRGELTPQEYFTFRDGAWHPVEAQGSAVLPGRETPPSTFQFSVLSWNVDFMAPEGDARMSAALKHLGSLVAGNPNPSVIMLNEMTPPDLALIKLADWVREGYDITDATADHWESSIYGTCMLVPRALPIKRVARLHYAATAMQRDALFADVALARGGTLRLCATHLESLRAVPPLRPAQLAAAAAHLRQPQPSGGSGGGGGGGGVVGVLAGDLNAIEPFDRTLHDQCGLKDAYLESGAREGEERGMTWGHMAPRWLRERFGLGRLDKVLFWDGGDASSGDGGGGDDVGGRLLLRLVGFETFGMDVVVEDEAAAARLMKEWGLEKAWVTDHLGVRADFRVEVSESVKIHI
ncbi:hypothetical protein MYCTH_2311932 [Thermothelomyces thermophilus ATCC 42464]|uniref:Endonuclease/exonuclease/phosphatase domain-containing protein n=1 Tax=Thermothelomyces thermophilus (strain ATCC 42464 / BCRC 31852 / DSM 1799) TaxID=573729 RepID=G2QPU5_THET4|nr:uncharacterized protein MYCTH_2311932 [Thermothelomyces thermophilus ATCC 42464]AEO61608.1 hypothetical protein MYCTH_2311932 [Thermothelomyces thermophilus ATCC 42464]